MVAKPKSVTFAIAASDLTRGLFNSLLFTGGDDALPVLTCISLECRDGKLQFISTDRYTIGVTTVALAAPDFIFTMKDDDARLLLKLFTTSRSGPALDVVIADDVMTAAPAQGVIDLALPRVTVEVHAFDATFPKWRTLLADMDSKTGYEPGEQIGFNPRYLTRFGRVKASNTTPVRLGVHSAISGVKVYVGDDFEGAIMPCRLAGSTAVVKSNAA